ncbi:hypothetical protein HNR25_003684 [Streptomonospora salina]|uniref:Uncharacterized protein n=1 Tax=Streptomonospora salina TaxID=104205 RepID=A0A841EFV7_9ACTN|nr:hypothetical protein [Streptomonospora salina]
MPGRGDYHDLLASRPPMNLRGMGVPDGWADDGFWNKHLA